ncbi:Piezo-type mechanosensitive ion channel component 2 [Phytophthora cinnamomi]|uniref:Piezo-type mechanosensitive ion channel component 2 n=1 Tax=Phytophthora cinnamomi TaxID=4785 RepID=UPI00355AB54B|nr:Piezo-type mechanosensitive ion channel component 2 [Phytophthora cinnamomi]
MRRPNAAGHDAAASSFIGADGRIVLTPTRPPTQDAAAAYGHVATPSFGSFRRDQSLRLNASGHRAPRPGHKLSLRALAALRTAAEVLFALCLMLAVGARANLVSLYYLLAFCYGTVQSFQSRAVTLLTLAVALAACVCHAAIRGIHGDDDSYAGADVAKLFGFRPMRDSKQYLQGVGVDALVLVCSAIHYWYVLRRLSARSTEQREEQQQHFDLFEMGEQLINRSEPKRDRRRSMRRVVELFSAVLLFLTSVSVPAFATGVLYLLLLQRLIGYTVFVRRMTVQELLSRKSGVKFSSYFLGPRTTNVVLGLCLVIIVAWYVFQVDQLTDNDTVQKTGNKSASICCLAMVICFTVQADLLNMVYVMAAFGFLIVENPRPAPTVWMHLLAYTCCIIALRYLFQLSIFCTGMTTVGYFYPNPIRVPGAPFLFEMRALLDYICTKTSLSWQHWVLLEDTAAHLFGVKGEMKGRVEEAEILQGKQRQPMKKKLTSAGVMLLFLLICLVGPLAMFSSINPSTTANEVTLTTVVFGIVDEQETMNQLYSNSDSNSPSCKVGLNTDSASVQCVEFDVFSSDVWTLSPPRMDLLVTQLQSTQALNWTIEFTFTRPGPTNDEVISSTYSVRMTDEHRNALIPMIKQTVNDDDSSTLASIQVDNLFPVVLQLTASSGVLRRSTEMRSVAVTKHGLDGSTWWTITPVIGKSGTNYCSAAYPFCVVTVSDRIVQGLTTLGISSYGLTAVYIFVVVTVGSAVKGFFRGKLFQIQYEELPDPEDVLELVEGIYIARHEHYVGHLKDEVRIFETLVRVLRSPETLIKVTGTNVIHIPTAKEKLD